MASPHIVPRSSSEDKYTCQSETELINYHEWIQLPSLFSTCSLFFNLLVNDQMKNRRCCNCLLIAVNQTSLELQNDHEQKFEVFPCRRHQAATDEDNDDERKLV